MTATELRALAERMAHLFRGGPTHAKYVADFTKMIVDGRTGKMKPTITAVPGPPTLEDFENHLRGKIGLLAIPATAEGRSCWGKIDIDDYNTDLVVLAKKVSQSGLSLIVERSKNGGAHLAKYWREWQPTPALRAAFAGWSADLGYPNVEIFPKQDKLAPDDMGNGLNLPYFGGDDALNYAVDETGRKLSVGEWLDRAEHQPTTPQHTPGSPHIVSAADYLAKSWTSGQRDDLNNAVVGALLRAKVDSSAVGELIAAVRSISGDNEYRKPVDHILADLQNNKRVKGFPEFARIVGVPEARELLRLMGGDPPPDLIPFAFETLPADWLNALPPALEHTVKPLFPRGTVALLVAEGGAGKTSFALRTALAVASGRALFGMDVTQGKVTYIAMEDQAASLRRRVHWIVSREVERMRRDGASPRDIELYLAAILANFTLVPGVGYELHLVTMTAGQVSQSGVISALIDKLPPATELLVLDPISRLNGAEENSNAVGTALINAAERIVREVSCGVLLTHHTGKSASKDKDATAYSARGASSLVDAARSSVRLMAVESLQYFEDVPPEVIQRGDLIQVIHNKCNDGPRAPPFYLLRQELDFERYAPEQLNRSRIYLRIMASIWTWFIHNNSVPFTQKRVTTADALKEIFGAQKPTRDQIRDAIKASQTAGDLVFTDKRSERSAAPLLTFRDGYVDPTGEM